MKKNKRLDIVFLLDRSGSMSGVENDTIGGYNSYIEKQKGNNVYVTTVLFDNEYQILNERKHIKEIERLTRKEYFVRGTTALYDAIGKTIKRLDEVKTDKVLFVITTDGYENASKEFNKQQVKELIQGHKDWEFIYIGANIDSYAEGSSIGIRKSNISNYIQDEVGIDILYNSISKATDFCMHDDYLSENWKENLENYIEKNKETL